MTPVTSSRTRYVAVPVLVVAVMALALAPVQAQRKNARNTTKTSLNQDRNTTVNVNRNANVNVNRNTNVNVNRNVNVNVNVNNRYGYYDHGPTVGGVIAATVVTAAVIGAIVHTLPPSCTTLVVNGLAYQNCGGTYYQPQYHGSSVSYVVVVHP
jgi:hypothetical protein